jgi:hypothetical protein
MKRPAVLWITALILGWCFDFLFWGHNPGISFAIYVALCLGGGLAVLISEGHLPSWKSVLLVLPIGFFAAMTFIRLEAMSRLLSLAFTLGTLGLLALTYLGGRWVWYSLADYGANFIRLVGSMLARPVLFINELKKRTQGLPESERQSAGGRLGWKRTGAVLRGLLISIPILAVFAALLASADAVFAQGLNQFIALFRLEKLPEYLFRLAYILVGAYLLSGVFLHAAQKSGDEHLIGEQKPLLSAFLGFTEGAVVLGAVELLFLIFVIIQVRYFFGGQTNIGVSGYTYAEYARQGFGELVAVAFFSLMLFLGLSVIVRRETPSKRRGFSGLGVGMVALVGVILASAFQRLRLYEAAYGFSRLRTYTHVFMIWLGVLLAVVLVLEILHRERLFVTAALLAGIGFAASLNLLNVDAFIVHENVARAAQGRDLDVAYLASLSPDAVPALAEAYSSNALPTGVRQAAGAALVCMQPRTSASVDRDWRSYSWSSARAQAARSRLDLRGYTVLVGRENSSSQVSAPGGAIFDCTGG